MWKDGPVPSGCGENPAILHSRPRQWARHNLRARPRLHPTDEDPSAGAPVLAEFSPATMAARICRYTLDFRPPRAGQQTRTQCAATRCKEQQKHGVESKAEDLNACMSPRRQHPALDLRP